LKINLSWLSQHRQRLRLVPLFFVCAIQGLDARKLLRTVRSSPWVAALTGKARLYALDLDLGAFAHSAEVRRHVSPPVIEKDGAGCTQVNDPIYSNSLLVFASPTRRTYRIFDPIVHVSAGRALIEVNDSSGSRCVGLAAGSTSQQVSIRNIRPILRDAEKIASHPLTVALFPWTNNFFHWIIEVIPTLECLDSQRGVDETLMIPVRPSRTLSTFQQETLKVLGISPVDFSDPFIRPRQALLASSPGLLSFSGSDGRRLQAFKERCKGATARESTSLETPRGDPIFISRSMSSRYSSDAQLLETHLLDYGWNVLNCEQLSLLEQVDLFAQSTLVAGSHGAGLGNVAWMSSNSQLIEVGSRKYWHASVPLLAEVMGVRYSFIDLDVVGPQQAASLLQQIRSQSTHD
jgi:hypothetical protein